MDQENIKIEVEQGQIWKHYAGGVYMVVCVAMRESDQRKQVVYQNIMGGPCWVRDLASWDQVITLTKTEEATKQTPRFSLIEQRRDQEVDRVEFEDAKPAGRPIEDRGPEY